MRHRTKAWLAAAAVLAVSGLLLFAAVMTVNHWDFSRLSTVTYETNVYTIDEPFSGIRLETETANVRLIPSDDEVCSVVCYEREHEMHSVSVQEDTLLIRTIHEEKWYDYVGITIGTPEITVALPQREYASFVMKGSTGDVELPPEFCFQNVDVAISTGNIKDCASAQKSIKLKTSTGHISVEGVLADEISLSATTGKVAVSDVNCRGEVSVHVSTGATELNGVLCRDMISNGTTGDITLCNMIADGLVSIERSTGSVTMLDSDAAEISITTATGNVTGSLLTSKLFFAESETGRVEVPKTVTGDVCTIRTETGDIHLEIKEKNDKHETQ